MKKRPLESITRTSEVEEEPKAEGEFKGKGSKRLKRNDKVDEDMQGVEVEESKGSPSKNPTKKATSDESEQVSKISVEVSTEPYRKIEDIRPLSSPDFDPV